MSCATNLLNTRDEEYEVWANFIRGELLASTTRNVNIERFIRVGIDGKPVSTLRITINQDTSEEDLQGVL